jgi:KaiC/GvpD/RAD55 family RecA-like ATPase
LNVLSHDVLVSDDVDEVAVQVSRLLVDIEHHRQRLHDLAYDDVEIEIGGSE